MKSRLAASACVILLGAVGCGGPSQTYSTDDVQEAFHGSLYPLPEKGRTVLAFGGPNLTIPRIATDLPATRDELDLEPFTVVVASDSEVDEAWPAYVAQQDAGSIDARRANVVVVSDGSGESFARRLAIDTEGRLTAEQQRDLVREFMAHRRKEIRAALASLPDRGFPVVVGS